MRQDILRSMADIKDATNAIILTHNIDFVFLQTVVMSAMKRCGHPTVTVFADAGCAADSFAHQYPVLNGLGIRYRVVPVAMDHGFRFHPKAVLLSGPDTAHLFVGSGNLTFGGWRENGETWVHMNVEEDSTAPFSAFRDFLWEILERVPLRDSVEAQVAEAFDPHTRAWASDMAEPALLVGRVGEGPPLLDRVLDLVGPSKVNEVMICAPFFDERGEALREILKRTNPTKARVLVQPERTTLIRKAWRSVSGRARLERVTFQHEDKEGNIREAFVHAKWYAFRRGKKILILSGSANVSYAALLTGGGVGNAELMALQRIPVEEFKEAFLDELTMPKEPVELPKSQPDKDGREKSGLRILAARYEAGLLRVAFKPTQVKVNELRIDDAPSRFELGDPGEIRVATATEPVMVTIVAKAEGGEVVEARGWVDHEHALKATSRGRSLSQTLHAKVRPQEWGVGAWAEILDVFGKHLRYLPSRTSKPKQGPNEKAKSNEMPEYTAADIFTPGYRLPSLPQFGAENIGSHDSRIRSLQQLLLRWFGIPTPDSEDQPEVPTQDISEQEIGENEGDELVDAAQILPDTPPPQPTPQASQQDFRRALRALDLVVSAMETPEFLKDRPPELLAADIRLASILLRVGLNEGWIDAETFFNATHRIWSAWFFTSEQTSGMGGLEVRWRESEDPDEFIKAMQSSSLTAALLAWALAIPFEGAGPEMVRFSLARVLAVARLPRLWDCDRDKIAEELSHILTYSSPDGDQAVIGEDALDKWERLLQQGHALRRLESVLRQNDLSHYLEMVPAGSLKSGDVLWQGPAGFCVVLSPVERKGMTPVFLLKLQGAHQPAKFAASSTLPIRALLKSATFHHDKLNKEVRQVLDNFFSEIAWTWQRQCPGRHAGVAGQ